MAGAGDGVRGFVVRVGHSPSPRAFASPAVSSAGTGAEEETGMNRSHGHAAGKRPTKTYVAWCSMIQRCNDPNAGNYARYGGRGIRVVERWLDFENFLSDMGEAPKGMSLDRVDNDGPYCKENCRWASDVEQRRNRRDVRPIEFRGRSQLLTDWAKELNVKVTTLYMRLYTYGWTVEKAFTHGVNP